MRLINSFNLSRSVDVFNCRCKRAIDTLGVGTRIALPVSLPLSSGIALATAFAAPVEVKTILSGALLPRLSPL